MDLQQIWQEHGSTIIAVAILLVIIGGAIKLLRPKPKVFAEDMTLNVRCRSCNWQGTVTKYNQVCRKCASDDLQHLGR